MFNVKVAYQEAGQAPQTVWLADVAVVHRAGPVFTPFDLIPYAPVVVYGDDSTDPDTGKFGGLLTVLGVGYADGTAGMYAVAEAWLLDPAGGCLERLAP